MKTEHLLREFVRRILEDSEPGGRPDGLPSYSITSDDLETFLEPFNDTTGAGGVKTWVPFQLRKGFVSHSELAKIGKAFGATPADAAQTFKKGKAGNWETPVKQPQFRGANKRMPKSFDPRDVFNYVLTYDDKARAGVLQAMADGIVRRFQSSKFHEVVAVDSSYSMSAELASLVANGLGVPMTTIKKEMDASKIEWDQKEFDRWVSSGEAEAS